MPFIKLPNGTVAHYRASRQRRRRCTCGAWAHHLCDWPVSKHDRKSGTCSAPMCDKHMRVVGEKEFCLKHEGELK